MKHPIDSFSQSNHGSADDVRPLYVAQARLPVRFLGLRRALRFTYVFKNRTWQRCRINVLLLRQQIARDDHALISLNTFVKNRDDSRIAVHSLDVRIRANM